MSLVQLRICASAVTAFGGVAVLYAAAVLFIAGVMGADPPPDVATALYWMNRTQQLPPQQWYGTTHRTEEGKLVPPFRAATLWAATLLSAVEEVVQPGLQLLQPTVVFSLIVCIVVLFPAAWFWSREVAALLLMGLNDTPNGRKNKEKEKEREKQNLQAQLTVVGAVSLLLLLLPAVASEAGLLRPMGLGCALCVWSFYFVVRNEVVLHTRQCSSSPSANDKNERDTWEFDFSHTVIEDGAMRCHPARRLPTQLYLLLFSLLWCVTCAMEPHFVYLAVAAALWAVTACYQQAFRRVVVMVQVPLPSTARQQAKEAGKVMRRAGVSCYRDLNLLSWTFLKLVLAFGAVVAASLVPFSSSASSAVSLVYTFVPPSVAFSAVRPAEINVSSSSASSSSLPVLSFPTPSVSGGAEAGDARCSSFASVKMNATCPAPTANFWFITEYAGVAPWTWLFHAAVSLYTTFTGPRSVSAAQTLFDNVALMCVTFLHAVPLVAFVTYRLQKPPLVFDSPLEQKCAVERERRRAATSGASTKGSTHNVSGNARADTVTCLSRSEYVLKQAMICCWFFIFSGIVSVLFGVQRDSRASPYLVALLAPVSCLISVAVSVAVAQRAHPESFMDMAAASLQQQQRVRGTHLGKAGDVWCLAAVVAAVLIASTASILPYTNEVLWVMLQVECSLVAVVAVRVWRGSWYSAACTTALSLALCGGRLLSLREADVHDAMRGSMFAASLLVGAAVYAAARVVELVLEAESVALMME
ncbi:hypothetical protein DQ04_08031040 [Trypanosoma grayi]|uniref:hypothetical protein n=1 Tax=Trypanosoma grayi TaxID=71804 RepID=UPI0004F402CB|nr:hypothetical protein DQ04_08031040 [Trypanosoma grayi]KEG08090.1 hypothetical protein DQ04_08031040 [Trypanosoma grayi]